MGNILRDLGITALLCIALVEISGIKTRNTLLDQRSVVLHDILKVDDNGWEGAKIAKAIGISYDISDKYSRGRAAAYGLPLFKAKEGDTLIISRYNRSTTLRDAFFSIYELVSHLKGDTSEIRWAREGKQRNVVEDYGIHPARHR
jgi:hypothetical protein